MSDQPGPNALRPPEPETIAGEACPFCGCCFINWYHHGGILYFLRCTECNSQTGLCSSKDEAIAAWNRRAPPADDAETVERVARVLCGYEHESDDIWDRLPQDDLERLAWKRDRDYTGSSDKDDYYAKARAVIAALRGERG